MRRIEDDAARRVNSRYRDQIMVVQTHARECRALDCGRAGAKDAWHGALRRCWEEFENGHAIANSVLCDPERPHWIGVVADKVRDRLTVLRNVSVSEPHGIRRVSTGRFGRCLAAGAR